MNIMDEVNKLIAEYFRKHNNIINSYDIRHEMIHDRDARLDAIELVCDIIWELLSSEANKVFSTPLEFYHKK